MGGAAFGVFGIYLAVWLGRVLQKQVDFLRAENRLLREKLGGKRIRLTDAER